MKTVVFTPTWNESANIESLIRSIFAELPHSIVLVVDDRSPDGTGRIVESMQPNFPNLHIIHRDGNRGRGWAGIDGYVWSLDYGADFVIEMDADFSHQPRYLPAIENALKNSDVVVGSRYIEGGKDLRPGLSRRFLSRIANQYQKWMFNTTLMDCTSGYRAYRASALEAIGVRRLDTWGPAILSDVLYRLIQKKKTIIEIPIEFPDREHGQSSLTWRILWEGIWNVAKLRMRGDPTKFGQ